MFIPLIHNYVMQFIHTCTSNMIENNNEGKEKWRGQKWDLHGIIYIINKTSQRVISYLCKLMITKYRLKWAIRKSCLSNQEGSCLGENPCLGCDEWIPKSVHQNHLHQVSLHRLNKARRKILQIVCLPHKEVSHGEKIDWFFFYRPPQNERSQ